MPPFPSEDESEYVDSNADDDSISTDSASEMECDDSEEESDCSDICEDDGDEHCWDTLGDAFEDCKGELERAGLGTAMTKKAFARFVNRCSPDSDCALAVEGEGDAQIFYIEGEDDECEEEEDCDMDETPCPGTPNTA